MSRFREVGKSRIVFCTTCKGRVQHLAQTLPQNLLDNSTYKNCKFVILDYGSQDNLLQYLKLTHAEELASGRLVVYSLINPSGPFKMAHAKNMVHRLGILEGGEILVNLDADNFTGPNFAYYIDNQFQSNSDIFLWAEMVHGVLPRGIHGRIVVHKSDFLKVGGYDEKYNEWGPDDKDFNARLTRLGLAGLKIDHQYLEKGVNHNDKMRFKEYPHVAEMEHLEDEFDLRGEVNTIANFGKFGCGEINKNFGIESDFIDLKPIPTRIFGIGMHKTATTSLHTALEILGVDSVHWKNAHWAKAVYNEMSQYGRSLTLEKHYAACDLPITILYRQIDKAYPGSKFILTLKSEESWINSVKAHWDYETNKFRATWDHDPFTHRLHTIVYGQRHFDADIFLARYRQHNEEVLKYFQNRPNDLLVMNMNKGAGWKELCGFIGKPIPAADVLYPRIDPTRPKPKEMVKAV